MPIPTTGVCVEIPELRIISDELWEKVQEVNRRGRDKYFFAGGRISGTDPRDSTTLMG
jgi:hypothetical protein